MTGCDSGGIACGTITDSIVFRSLASSVLSEAVFARSISATDRSNSLMRDEMAPEDREAIGIAGPDWTVGALEGEDLSEGALPAIAGFSASGAISFSMSEALFSILLINSELLVSPPGVGAGASPVN